jgi:hypothetical protein
MLATKIESVTCLFSLELVKKFFDSLGINSLLARSLTD